MQLLGATQWFISKHFIVRGVKHGVYGAFIAILLLSGVIYLMQKQIPELIELQDIDLFVTLFVFVIILGVFITFVSTLLAVRKYVRLKTADLYY